MKGVRIWVIQLAAFYQKLMIKWYCQIPFDDGSVLSNSHNRQGSSTPLRGAMKYVAGYIAMKCISKFNCSNCKASFTRINCNIQTNDDLLIFLKRIKYLMEIMNLEIFVFLLTIFTESL